MADVSTPDERSPVGVYDFPTACKLLGVHVNTGYRMAERGEFPGLLPRIGRRHRVGRDQLDAYLAGRNGSAA